MSKSKSKGSKDATKSSSDILTKVKDAAVVKPAQTVKAKSKEIAKAVTSKEEKKSKKQKVKEPTPEPSDSESEESESESEESESESEASASSADSDSDSDSDDETEIKKPVANGKVNGKVAAAAESSDESESSEDEAPAKKANSVKAPAANIVSSQTLKADSSDSEEASDEEEEEEDSDDNEEEEKPKAKAVAKPDTKKVAAVAPEDSDADEDEEDSDDSEGSAEDSDDSDDSDESEAEVKPKPAQKRKAEEAEIPAAKKSKTEASGDAPESGNLFVGNLSWNVDEDWLTREFETFGELSGVRIITDRETGRSKGFGYVEFVNAADAAKAHAEKAGSDLDGRTINVDFAAPRQASGNQQDRANDRRKSYGDSTSAPSDTLFCGNLSFDAGQDAVSEAFGEYGTILGVRLPTDRETGNPKGFGYVTFASVEEATAAMEAMQGADIAGRSVRLDYSQPRPQNGDSPARGRGGFGGGRGGGRGFGDRGGRGGGRGFGDRGGRGGGRGRGFGGDRGGRGGRGASTNRGGFGDFSGKKTTF